MKNQSLSLCHSIVQSKGNLGSDMGGEKVLLSIENGKYYNLGDIGGKIWDLIQSPIQVSELVNMLLEQYEVEKDECEEHVIGFLHLLLEEGLVNISDAR